MLAHAPVDAIVAGLMDDYNYHYQDRQHRATNTAMPIRAASTAVPLAGKSHPPYSKTSGHGWVECRGRRARVHLLQLP